MRKAALLAAGVLSAGASAAWEMPNLGAVVTPPGAIREYIGKTWCGHVQGMCVSSNAIYFSFHNQLVKTDWFGRLLERRDVDAHGGDVCIWNGRLYTGVWLQPAKGSGEKPCAAIGVYDAGTLKLVEMRKLEWGGVDGITCLDGVIYLGMGGSRDRGKNFYGKFDAATLEPLCEPFGVDADEGSICGAQNMCTDGKYIYASHYVNGAETKNVAVHDKNDFKVVARYRFGQNNGLDVVPGGRDGALRFAWCFTPNWRNRENHPAPPVCAVVMFGELKDGQFRDVTYYGDPSSLARAKPE